MARVDVDVYVYASVRSKNAHTQYCPYLVVVWVEMKTWEARSDLL